MLGAYQRPIPSTRRNEMTEVTTPSTVTHPNQTAGATKPKVKNFTAWVAAFSPSLSGFVALFVGYLLWGDFSNWTGVRPYFLFALRIALIFQAMRWDYRSLRKQGFDPEALKIAKPTNLPVYLFSRAKAFGQSRAYAYTWVIVVLCNVLVELL
jgi:hypothetical protein